MAGSQSREGDLHFASHRVDLLIVFGLSLVQAENGLADGGLLEWSPSGSDLLSWLLAGRRHGPVFLTDRRASPGTNPADVCPLSGRGRMSYRRAAEIFTTLTRPLDPAGRGWTLHQLRAAQRP